LSQQFSESDVRQVAGELNAIMKHLVNATPMRRLDLAKQIARSQMNSSPNDLKDVNAKSATTKFMIEEAARSLLREKHAGGSGTYSNIPPTGRGSPGPGPSFPGNDVAKDKPVQDSTFSKSECVQRLTDLGMEDSDLIDRTCEEWLGGTALEGKSKNASIQSPPAYITARSQLFTGGPPPSPKYTLDNIKNANSNNEAPAWVQTTFAYRANHDPSDAEKQAYQEARMKSASMDRKSGKSAWQITREHLLGVG